MESKIITQDKIIETMRENPNKWFGIQELARMFKTTENNMSLKLTLLRDKLIKIDLGRTGRPLRGARVLYRVNKRYGVR